MMKLKSTVILATIVVTMGLLVGTSAAQEPRVIFEEGTDKAIGIENLEVNGILYNVEFTSRITAAEVYGRYPGQFDTNPFTVQSVTDLVNSALESANALIVGAVGSEPVPCYSIGFESGDAGINGAKSVVYLDSCGWETPLGTTVWSYANGVEAIKSSPYNDSLHVWAKFTEAPKTPEQCRAEKFECLDAADATRETCIEESDTRADRRACRSAYRVARSECREEFRSCLADLP